MEWFNGRTSPISTNMQSARKKLQKTMSGSRNSISKRGSQDSTATSSSYEPPRHRTSSHPTIPLPADLTDSRWLDYIERSGLMGAHRYSSYSDPRPGFVAPQPHLVPELAHLQINDMVARPSHDNMLSSSAPTSKPRRFTLKRNGKPSLFFRTGSQDNVAPEIKPVEKRASVELIADQYNAMLEHRYRKDAEAAAAIETPMASPAAEAPAQSVLLSRIFEPSRPRKNTTEDRHRKTTVEVPPQIDPPELSPRSDGTLVAFEEDAIYFKPVSFSPSSSPTPERQRADQDRSSIHSAQSDRNMQTCIDLLTKQLSSTMSEQARSPVEPAVQVWAMIEMYEKLREQLYEMNLGESERRNVSLMFDCWLSSLHSIHDSLAPNKPRPRGQHCEDYGQVELD